MADTAGVTRFARQVGAMPRRLVRSTRARWRHGLLAGRAQPRWWPEGVAEWPGLRSPHADKEVVLFAGGRRYEFAPATLRGFSGHVHHGTRRPTADDVAASLARLDLPVEVARSMATVSSFEGGYDAIQTYDSAKFSWGFIQFSASGGLYDVLEAIKGSQPAVFASVFEPAGIDTAHWQVLVRRDGRTFVGPRAQDLLHDDPTLWTPFITAAGITGVQDAQTRVAYERYYLPMMQATTTTSGGEMRFGDVFAHSEVGRTLLFDRAVRLGPASAVALFRGVMERCGARVDQFEAASQDGCGVDAIVNELLLAEAHDGTRLGSIISQLADAEPETR